MTLPMKKYHAGKGKGEIKKKFPEMENTRWMNEGDILGVQKDPAGNTYIYAHTYQVKIWIWLKKKEAKSPTFILSSRIKKAK